MLIVHVALHFSCNAADFFGPQVAVQCRKLYGDKTNIQRNEHIFKMVNQRKYISNKQSYAYIRRTSDRLCKENGLSVVKPGQSKGKSVPLPHRECRYTSKSRRAVSCWAGLQ